MYFKYFIFSFFAYFLSKHSLEAVLKPVDFDKGQAFEMATRFLGKTDEGILDLMEGRGKGSQADVTQWFNDEVGKAFFESQDKKDPFRAHVQEIPVFPLVAELSAHYDRCGKSEKFQSLLEKNQALREGYLEWRALIALPFLCSDFTKEQREKLHILQQEYWKLKDAIDWTRDVSLKTKYVTHQWWECKWMLSAHVLEWMKGYEGEKIFLNETGRKFLAMDPESTKSMLADFAASIEKLDEQLKRKKPLQVGDRSVKPVNPLRQVGGLCLEDIIRNISSECEKTWGAMARKYPFVAQLTGLLYGVFQYAGQGDCNLGYQKECAAHFVEFYKEQSRSANDATILTMSLANKPMVEGFPKILYRGCVIELNTTDRIIKVPQTEEARVLDLCHKLRNVSSNDVGRIFEIVQKYFRNPNAGGSYDIIDSSPGFQVRVAKGVLELVSDFMKTVEQHPNMGEDILYRRIMLKGVPLFPQYMLELLKYHSFSC